jgi:hypothetical protein
MLNWRCILVYVWDGFFGLRIEDINKFSNLQRVSYLTIANRKYSVDLWEFNDVSIGHTVSLLRTVSSLQLSSNCDSAVPIHNSKSSVSVEDSVSKILSVDCEDLLSSHSGTKALALTAARHKPAR